jgi:hypothetical protein
MKRVVFGATFVAVGVILLLLLAEGLCSVAYVISRSRFERTPERSYSQFDPDLGWSSIPGARLPDAFGPGRDVAINSRGFRGTAEVDEKTPPGKVRVICSGDSFTFGIGVRDEAAWPWLLAQLEPRFETVNMGQGAYGIDQSYLSFLRDGVELEPDVHLFCFIRNDFDRARWGNWASYEKPLLTLRDGKPVALNAPLRRPSLPVLLWRLNQNFLVGDLRLLRVLQPRFFPQQSEPPPPPFYEDEPFLELVDTIFESLEHSQQQHNGLTVLVYLPVKDDFEQAEDHVRAREAAHLLAERRNIPLVDLTEDLIVLPLDSVQDLFLQHGAELSIGAEKHYSEAGNEFVARSLHRRLLELPEVREKLASAAP